MTSRISFPTLAFGAGLCAVFLVLVPPNSPASPREENDHSLPPDSCKSAPCLKGVHAFFSGSYAEAARHLERALEMRGRERFDLEEYTTASTYAAVARSRAGDHLRAARHWERLSKVADAGTQFYTFRALRSQLDAEETRAADLKRLERRDALGVPFPGVQLARLEYRATVDDTVPNADAIRRALERESSNSTCEWLSEVVSDGETETIELDSTPQRLADLLYGHCLPPRDGGAYPGQPDNPHDLARIRRAEHLYGRVQFDAALEELREVDFDSLALDSWCRARFRLGRTLYRLDRYTRSMRVYRSVVDRCTGEKSVNPRIRSLYALGKRHYFINNFKKSQSRFETILEDYPDRSHADDALLFLGRIARKRGDRERERELLDRALENYPDGDMVHEFVWEVLEGHVKRGDYSTFVDRLDELSLPDSDHFYYSQGRLLYFRALSELELGLESAALDHFRETWRRYPFSFYGYLSNLRLRERGVEPPDLAGGEATAPPDWFYATNWRGTAVRRLDALGLHELAAQLQAGRNRALQERGDERISEADRWRLASLYHRAGRHIWSHNIPRRQIEGRPWVEPALGRTTRWRIAFPAPFRGLVEDAVRIEDLQRPKARVSPFLPMAIMREESGFDAEIESWAGAVGLMQLMPSTAKGHDDDLEVSANPDTLRQPHVNIRIGVDHLHLLARYFSNHPAVMVASYNAGMGAVGDWLPSSDGTRIALWVEDIPYRQARNYTKRVMGSYAAYQWLAGQRHLDPTVGNSPPVR